MTFQVLKKEKKKKELNVKMLMFWRWKKQKADLTSKDMKFSDRNDYSHQLLNNLRECYNDIIFAGPLVSLLSLLVLKEEMRWEFIQQWKRLLVTQIVMVDSCFFYIYSSNFIQIFTISLLRASIIWLIFLEKAMSSLIFKQVLPR